MDIQWLVLVFPCSWCESEITHCYLFKTTNYNISWLIMSGYKLEHEIPNYSIEHVVWPFNIFRLVLRWWCLCVPKVKPTCLKRLSGTWLHSQKVVGQSGEIFQQDLDGSKVCMEAKISQHHPISYSGVSIKFWSTCVCSVHAWWKIFHI